MEKLKVVKFLEKFEVEQVGWGCLKPSLWFTHQWESSTYEQAGWALVLKA
jgi:hypothetical protein